MEQFPQEMGNQNTPAMSDHVVVKKDILESVLQDWIQFGCLTTPTCEGVQAAIDSTSPEMVPMSEVDNLISAIEHYRDECPSDPDLTHGFYAAGLALESTIHAFNAKFKV